MKSPLWDLWDQVTPQGGPCPAPRPREVARLVNKTLDAVPSERKRHMRQKIKTAALLAAAFLLLTGSVFAAARNWTVLDAFFGGGSQEGEALMNKQAYSVSDDNYTLTITSSLADGVIAYLTVTVEAKTPESVKRLMADDFENIDTWSFHVPRMEEDAAGGVVASVGTWEAETLRTADSRTWNMELKLGSTPETVSIRLGVMEKGLWLEAPLTLAESVTVTVGAEGIGAGTYEHSAGGPVTLETVTLSPLGLTLHYTYPAASGQSRPVPAFLGYDGTLYTWSQLVSDQSKGGGSHQKGETVAASTQHAFRTVWDLSQLEAIVFEGMAYPLNGDQPCAVDVSDMRQSFLLPLVDRIAEGYGFAVPVRALCENLGGTCLWDSESRSAAMTFRDVTIVLTEGETTALVDGQTVEMYYAPVIRNGQMSAAPNVFADAWLLDLCAAAADGSVKMEDGSAWVVIP